MLIPGTHMHIIPFIFACLESVILFYLLIYYLARPDNKKTILDILLVFFLLLYNIVTGLLPDPYFPGSIPFQICLAYATGFMAPSFFPYYVYKGFGLTKMQFHAYKGWLIFLVPYVLFVIVFYSSKDLNAAKIVLILPFMYGIWILYSLISALRHKYGKRLYSRKSKEEIIVLLLSLISWAALPVNDYFDAGPVLAAVITNIGFLLLLGLHVQRHVKTIRLEHQRLIDSEQRLLFVNNNLKSEVANIRQELQTLLTRETNEFTRVFSEINVPLTAINYNLGELNKYDKLDDLAEAKLNFEKLSREIEQLMRIGSIYKGIAAHRQDLVSHFGDLIKNGLLLVNQALQALPKPEIATDYGEQKDFEQNCTRYNLTRREIDIVKLIEKGLFNKEISTQLQISDRTVDAHIHNLFKKLHVSNRIELINKLKTKYSG